MSVRVASVLAFISSGLALWAFAGDSHVDEPALLIADRLYTVADDFVVEIYHNGKPVPDGRRTLLEEVFGATAEQVDIEVYEGDWIVFNVVNNRLRWGGCSYFGVTGRGPAGIVFTTKPGDASWSYCDDPAQVARFINDSDYLALQQVRPIESPWSGGDSLMNRIADGWSGKPVWGERRNTWIKYRAHPRPADVPR